MNEEKNFSLNTEEGRRNHQAIIDKRNGLYIAQQLIIDKVAELDTELRKYSYIYGKNG